MTRHVTYYDSQLRAPLRPVSTGPRPDDGLATWPFEATFAWTLFDDDIKVVRHGVQDGFGAGTAIYHSLNHQGPVMLQRKINASTLFPELQRTAGFGGVPRHELPYKRHILNPQTPIRGSCLFWRPVIPMLTDHSIRASVVTFLYRLARS